MVAAPLRLGGGMRVKVLESLAAGKAMVATPRAVAGLGLEPGTHALVAESDGELSDALVSLLDDPGLRRRYGRRSPHPGGGAARLGARDGGVRRALRVPAGRAGRRRRMTRPRVAFVGWRLGGELERVIALGHERFDYTVISMDLDEALRPLVDWRRMPKPTFGSFRLGWVAFFAVGGLRLARIDADLVHAVGPVPGRAERRRPQHGHLLPRRLRRGHRRASDQGQLELDRLEAGSALHAGARAVVVPARACGC